MFNILNTYIPDPIFFSIGSFAVRWYGLILAFALLIGYILSKKLARMAKLSGEEISSIYANLALWGLVGARLYHVFNEPSFYFSNPAEIIAVWKGGLAIHGAIIAGIAYLIYAAAKNHLTFWRLADLFAIPLILGQALGRWVNYFNQELFGRPTALPWGIPIAPDNRPAGYDGFTFFHPTFFYESIWNFLIFAVLLILYKKNTKKISSQLMEGDGRKPPEALAKGGLIFWAYLFLYSLGRIGVELLRVDDVPIVLGIRLPLLVSLALFFAAAVFLLKLYSSKSSPS